MTAIAQETFRAPQAWTGADFNGVEDVAYALGARPIAALEDCLARVKRDGVDLPDITLAHFRHPDLDDELAKVLREIMQGRGMVVLRGLPVDRYDADDIAKMYWGIGTHFGHAVSQSATGDVLGHVRDLTKPGQEEEARGYTSARELRPHTDLGQMAGLLCYRQAAAGGVSVIASALAIHNQIAAEHPEHLPILYRGFHYHRRGEQAPEAAPVTPYQIPVFSQLEGNTNVFYVREILQNAYTEMGQPLRDEEIAALDCFDACARANSFHLRLEPGDALLMNNRKVLHARTKFENGAGADSQRHLMRLWLDIPTAPPELKELQIYENVGGRSGIDGQKDGRRAGPEYRIKDLAKSA